MEPSIYLTLYRIYKLCDCRKFHGSSTKLTLGTGRSQATSQDCCKAIILLWATWRKSNKDFLFVPIRCEHKVYVMAFGLLFLSNWKRASTQGSVNYFIRSLLIEFLKSLITNGSVQTAKKKNQIMYVPFGNSEVMQVLFRKKDAADYANFC